MPFCSALTNHCCVSMHNTYIPCCRFAGQFDKVSPVIHFDKFRTSDFYQGVVNNMKTGWDEGCRSCQLDESIGKASLRQYYNSILSGKNNYIEYIELSVSNFCNLSCKMCNNIFSSKWEGIVSKNQELLKFNFTNEKSNEINFETVFANLDLSKLHLIKYLGGEPFITPQIVDIIEFLETNSNINNIVFKTNTNGTFFPEKLIPHILKFKSVDLSISVDGLDSLCNYIRTGEEWATVKSVIDKWVLLSKEYPKVRLILHTTLQAYNLHQLDDIRMYALDKGMIHVYSILNNPKHLTLNCLPKEYTDSLNLKDSKIKNLLSKNIFDEEYFNKFKEYTLTVDKIQGTSVKEVIPELYKYF